jgi:3-oxoadipate enol-lactonase
MAFAPTVLNDLYVDDQGPRNGAAALLWPSLFTDHSMWRAQTTALHAAGWRTLALDPPGHGQSKGVERDFTMDECAEAGIQVLDTLNVRTPVLLLGTSWGGMIAPRIASRAPDRVRGMVLFNTTAESATLFDRIKNTLLTKMLAIRALDKTVDNMLVSLQLSAETRQREPEIPATLVRNFRSWNRRGLINSVKSVLVDRDSSLERLSGVQAPALVVSGKEDTILPSSYSRRITERLRKAHHVEVPGAAHLVPLESAATANALILDFTKSLPAI